MGGLLVSRRMVEIETKCMSGIVIWKRKVYDLDGVCLITQICLGIIILMYSSNCHVVDV